jgi:hypothetical protein
MFAPFDLENPSYANISGLYARPRTKRAYLHRPGDVCIVEARPDFTFLIKDAISPSGPFPLAGFGFLIGADKQPAGIECIARSFAEECIPILSQSLIQDGIRYSLSALCLERCLCLRLAAVNSHPGSSLPVQVYFSTIQTSLEELYEHGNEDYVPFQNNALPWLDPLDVSLADGALWYRGALRAVVSSTQGFRLDPVEQASGRLVLFSAELPPGGQAALELVIPYGDAAAVDLVEIKALRWQAARAETLAFYRAHLARGARLRTPEPVVNRLFDTLRLNALQMLGSRPGSRALYPGQGGMNPFGTVYGMEATAWLPVLTRLGYADEAGRVMDYLLTTQRGSPGPEGDISDPSGSFRPHIHWMCETGAALTLLCSYGLFTQDRGWFQQVEGQLRAACDFILRERDRTKSKYAPGEAGYGLLPAGRPHDWPDYGQFLFSDAYTWKGLNLAAEVYTAFGHPFGAALRAEAADYRQCILDSFHKSIYPHPVEPGRLWFSSEVHTPAGVEVGSYGGDGPMCLVHAGVLSAEDPLVSQMEWDSQRRGFLTPLFAHIMSGMEDEQLAALQRRHAGGPYDLIYVTFSEIVWQRAFMERGERSRALAYLFSTLAYATSYDLGLAHERFCPQLPWLLPWQPNASANGRILEMMIAAICFEKENCLYLFAGVPEAWLDESIRLEDYLIPGGCLSLNTARVGDQLVVSLGITRALPAILPARVAYCLPPGWIPAAENLGLVKDEKGWYRGALGSAKRAVFRREVAAC